MLLAKLSSLAKWLKVRLRTKWFWVRVQLQSKKLTFSLLVILTSSIDNAFHTRKLHLCLIWKALLL